MNRVRYIPRGKPRDWSAKLREMRARYPHRLVISKEKSPKPPDVEKDGTNYGAFGYMPMDDGNEWMFLTKEARKLFQAKYGGTILGEE